MYFEMTSKATQKNDRPKRATRGKTRRNELILDALERLLSDMPLKDLGVEQIAEAAGISRTRFYFYYKSKYQALAALLHRVSEEVLEVYSLPDSWFLRQPEARPRDSLALTFRRMADVWLKHGAAVREACDMWNAVPEVRQTWQQIISGLIDATSAAIERERERNVAPPGPDARLLAQSLVWQGERQLFLSLIDALDAANRDELNEIGPSMWMRAIYLADDPNPR